jgi:hypothetical protein
MISLHTNGILLCNKVGVMDTTRHDTGGVSSIGEEVKNQVNAKRDDV